MTWVRILIWLLNAVYKSQFKSNEPEIWCKAYIVDEPKQTKGTRNAFHDSERIIGGIKIGWK